MASASVIVALMSGILVAVVRADGYRAPQFDLHDAGIWVVQRNIFAAGRLDTELNVIDTKVRLDGKKQDVLQSGSTVLIREEEPTRLRRLNVRTGQVDKGAGLPADALVALGGQVGAVLDRSAGQLWIAPGNQLSAYTQSRMIPLPGASAVAVGLDGIVHVLVEAADEVVRLRADGTELDRKRFEKSLKATEITAVGSTSVVLDRDIGTLAVPGGRTLPGAELGTGLRLQQPGPDHAEVLVASDTRLGTVSLDGTPPQTLWGEGTGAAVAPVRLGACSWGAWQGQPTRVHRCNGRPPEDAGPITNLKDQPGMTLQFRVNRNRVVLNELASGTVLMVDEGTASRIDDWDQALQVEQTDDGSRDPNASQTVVGANRGEGSTTPTSIPLKDGENLPPEAADDTAATRERRPVVIGVLANDRDPNGDVLVVEAIDPVPAQVGVINIVRAGTAVQFTPAPGLTQQGVFRYTVSDGRGGKASAKVTVAIRPPGVNTAPEAVPDTATVEVGRTVVANVLANDRDADGDALVLVKASAPKGTVQFRPDGAVVFSAGGAAPGVVVVPYEIVDELNVRATGELRVTVTSAANVKPIAVDDHLTAFAGREATVDVLANDSDPNGDPLTVFRVDNRSGAPLQWTPTGEMRIRAEKPGTYLLTYEITDGPSVDAAEVRIDVTDLGAQHPPVAVRDDVVVRPGQPTLVQVLANDIDADGDVLVIDRVQSDLTAKGVLIETIEHQALQILATNPLPEAASFTYTINDGTAQSVGTVVLRTVSGGVNQPPVAGRDELSIRAGNVTAIRVLANDVDPDGDELTLDRVTEIAASDGVLFKQGNQLRYQAPDVEKGAVQARYTVTDSAGNSADGELIIHVTPLDPSRNAPPVAATLEARVVAGAEVTIRVPLVGIDPDGDAVTFLGFGEPPKLGTIVETSANTMLYLAGKEAAGTDRFTYRLRDALGAEASGAVLVGVIAPPAVNSPPVAVPDRASVRAGESVRIPVLANDSDPDGDAIDLVAGELGRPSRGSARAEERAVVFDAPPASPEGEVSFDYTIVDSRGANAHSTATVNITGTPVPKSPIARDDLVAPQVTGASVVVDVLENDEDPDGDTARLRVDVGGQPGVAVSDGKVKFTMGDRALSFSYTVTDAQDLTARALVQVPLVADLPPVAETDRAETEFNTPVKLSVLTNDKDPEGKGLTLTRIVGGARNGTAEVQGSQVQFSPQKDFAGEGGFAYEVTDGKNTAQGSAIVTVKAAVNRPPKATTLTLEVPAGARRDLELSKGAEDPDGDKLTFANAASDKAGVTVSLNGSTLSATASPTTRGVEARITFDVSDGKPDGKIQGSALVRVLASEKPLPSAVNDTARTAQDKPVTISVLANDTDPAGVGLRIGSVTAGTGGTPEIQGDQVLFTPTKDFFGQASFSYAIFDKTGDAERTARASVDVSVIGVPSAPAAPTGVAESRKVTLQWTAPAANGAPIDKYEVQTDAGASQRCAGGSATSCVIEGLTNGTAYRFQVRAHNEAGNSAWSASSSPDLIPDQRPDTPPAPTAQFGDRQLGVTWAAPANEGTPISEYTIEISPPPPSGVGTQTVGGGSLTYQWQGLENGVAYRFRIKAKNGAGPTEFGPYSSAETPAGAPARPAAPTVSDGDGQVIVNWVAPATNGAAIQAYDLQVSRDGAPHHVESISDPSLRSMAVVADNGRGYTFALQAKNRAGPSGFGADSTTVTPCGKPAGVGDVQGTEGDTTSTLSFAEPASNGCAITGYRYRPTGGSDAALPGTRVIGGLTNGTNYSFQVQACNTRGCGTFSASSNTVNPFGVPGQPGVSGSVNGQTLNWNWTTPAANGRPITRFDVFLDGTLAYQGMNTSFSRSFGYSERHTLEVAAVNERGTGARGGSAITTEGKPRTATVSRGAAVRTSFCTDPSCAYMAVSVSGFAPNANVHVTCYTTFDPNGQPFYDYDMRTNGNGDASSSVCIHGYPNREVWVTVDGVRSPNLRW